MPFGVDVRPAARGVGPDRSRRHGRRRARRPHRAGPVVRPGAPADPAVRRRVRLGRRRRRDRHRVADDRAPRLEGRHPHRTRSPSVVAGQRGRCASTRPTPPRVPPWFNVLSWQGASETADGGSSITELVRQPDGSYRTARPGADQRHGQDAPAPPARDPACSRSRSTSPRTPAIPAEGVPAEDGVRSFVADKRVLQREARTDNVNLERAAYVLLALVAAGWMAVIAWGLRRLENPPAGDATPRTRDETSTDPLTIRRGFEPVTGH